MDEESILMEALSKIDPVERDSYLDDACSNDESLRKNVESLIKAHEMAGSFLNQPAEGFTLPERSQPTVPTQPTVWQIPWDDCNSWNCRSKSCGKLNKASLAIIGST